MDKRTHHFPKHTCYYCGKKAVAGCDGIKHYKGYLDNGYPKISTKDPESVVFCDRLMCDEHAKVVGMITKSGSVDTIDYCKEHAFKEINGISPEIKYSQQ